MIEILKDSYPIDFLCKLMNVNRSGYYKWKSRLNKPNQHEANRRILTELLQEAHEKHPSYGYHRLAVLIRKETGWIFSDNLAHKCCKTVGIKSKARKITYSKPNGEEHYIYPNIISGNWNATMPLEIIVSDMTIIKHKGTNYEWTYLLDTFNNEIISHHISRYPGDRTPYYQCLEDLKKQTKKKTAPTVLHTDQGAVYASANYNRGLNDYNIKRSMSRVGTPTDNPIIESINGWVKEEMKIDFEMDSYEYIDDFLAEFVVYYNTQRPSYSLNYMTPIEYKNMHGW